MPVKLIEERDTFDAFQQRVLLEVLVTVRDALIDPGVTDDQRLREATEELSLNIACIFDGSTIIKLDGTRVVPVLTFARELKYDQLIHSQGGTWMHESCDDELLAVAFAKSDE